VGKSLVLTLDGIGELSQALSDLPAELQAEARVIVHAAAIAAADDLRTAYGSSKMADHVYVVDNSVPMQEKWTVESRAKEAVWWEFGTQNRHTQAGWNRGSAPAHRDQGLMTIAKRIRREMYDGLRMMASLEPFYQTEIL